MMKVSWGDEGVGHLTWLSTSLSYCRERKFQHKFDALIDEDYLD
jgi:hypothetical protein